MSLTLKLAAVAAGACFAFAMVMRAHAVEATDNLYNLVKFQVVEAQALRFCMHNNVVMRTRSLTTDEKDKLVKCVTYTLKDDVEILGRAEALASKK
jgi:hypothetical protein